MANGFLRLYSDYIHLWGKVMLPRILTGLVGLLMAVIALGWLADPSSAAAGLGMPLLDSRSQHPDR